MGRRTGRAELDEHAEGVHVTEFDIKLKAQGRPKEAVYADIRQRLRDLPASISISQPIAHRIDPHAVRRAGADRHQGVW